MSWLQFLSTLIGNILSWPVAIIVAVVILHTPLGNLIGRVKSYEGFGQKVQFGQQLAQAELSVQELGTTIGSLFPDDDPAEAEDISPGDRAAPGPEPGVDRPQSTYGERWSDTYLDDVERNPSYVLLSSWERLLNDLEVLARRVSGDGATSPGQRFSLSRQLNRLQTQEVVNRQFVNAVNDLRDLRNAVAHGEHNPSAGEAIAYYESAQELSRATAVLGENWERRRTIG